MVFQSWPFRSGSSGFFFSAPATLFFSAGVALFFSGSLVVPFVFPGDGPGF